MKITILDAATLGADLDLSPLSRFGECTVYGVTSAEEIAARVRDAEVIVINKIRVGEALLAEAKCLRLVCITATGYDNVDVAACRRHGIAVCNVRGYSTDSVAQLTVAMGLALLNRLFEYRDSVRDGSYTRGGVANILTPVYHEIAGKTWGVIGLGNIGEKVAAVAEALGCRVIAYRRTPRGAFPCVDLDTLLTESDVVSIHTPLNDGTRGLIGAPELAKMKSGAILLNVARGAVTDEAAVAEAVRSGHLGGIGIDVYSTEPFPETHPFYAIKDLPNVCLTPHMAWSAKEARERCIAEICENIAAFTRGESRNRVDLL